MLGAWQPVPWEGRTVHTWRPPPANSLLCELSPRTQRLAEAATAAVQACGTTLPRGWEPLARLLLRTEGVASSRIEDVRAPLADVAAAEVDRDVVDPSAAWIADNLDAVVQAVKGVDRPLSLAALHDWHRTLMRSATDLDIRFVGSFRDRIGWIGAANPHLAPHVGTAPDEIEPAMADLVAFVNREDIDATVQAGLAHAQFELIHPYADGNGRLGRVLVGWVLMRRLALAVPPPVSVVLARDRTEYVGGLSGYRELGPDHWLRFFAREVHEAASGTTQLLVDVSAVVAEWRANLSGVRADAAARRALDVLAGHPVVTAELLARELDVSTRAARAALAVLRDREIVTAYRPARQRPGRPAGMWQATRLVALVATWGGAAPTPAGAARTQAGPRRRS